MTEVFFDDRKTVYELPEELIGIWRGNYQENSEGHYAELIIDESSDDRLTYKGHYYYEMNYPYDQLRASYEANI